MNTVTGFVLFDRARISSTQPGMEGISNVPVVLQNTSNNVFLAVLTDSNGAYEFFNVPNGNYRIVEAFKTPANPTPGDFNTASEGNVITGAMPPLSFINNPPTGATNLDATTPNTILVTIDNNNLDNENFLNGPVRYTPITSILDNCTSVLETNLITDADDGTFGSFPDGTPPNTGVPTNPYPNIAPDFTYVLPNPDTFTPDDGEFTIQNLMNNSLSNRIGAWWRIADHTTGNETGRMMVVNGFEPGSVFFTSTVSVKPNTDYLFSAWILNMFKVTGFANPALGVRILDENGNTLYNATLGTLIPVNTNTPEWKQIGTVINSQNNTTITVKFLSEGPAAIGNDYAIDDVSFNEVVVPTFTPVKTASNTNISVNETVTYTVTLTNDCESPLTNVFFKDAIPNGLSFIPNSVSVNDVEIPNANPNTGFTIPNILGGQTATITFSVIANFIPEVNPTINKAMIDYLYTPVEGGIPLVFNTISNEVPVEISAVPVLADVAVTKEANLSNTNPGDTVIYTITIRNLGPASAENVILTDNISPSILNPEFSVDNGTTFNTWEGTFDFGTLTNNTSRVIIIRGTIAPNATFPISNTATVASTTPDPDLSNNTSTVIINSAEGRCTSITDIIESVALQETALAHILNAEGEKIQKALNTPNIAIEKLLEINQAATNLINNITRLEAILQAKLQLFTNECVNDNLI